MIIVIRILCLIFGAAFLALVVWASVTGDFGESFAIIGGLAWGKVSLADLYLGFLIVSIFYFLIETKWIAASLAIATILLGNVIPALWIAARLPLIVDRRSGGRGVAKAP